MLPGHTLRFAAIGVAEAEAARRDLETRVRAAIAAITIARPPGGIDLDALYRENLIDGVIA
jgi:allophanate hydrolase